MMQDRFGNADVVSGYKSLHRRAAAQSPSKKRILRMIPRFTGPVQTKWQLKAALFGLALLSSVALVSFTGVCSGVSHRRRLPKLFHKETLPPRLDDKKDAASIKNEEGAMVDALERMKMGGHSTFLNPEIFKKVAQNEKDRAAKRMALKPNELKDKFDLKRLSRDLSCAQTDVITRMAYHVNSRSTNEEKHCNLLNTMGTEVLSLIDKLQGKSIEAPDPTKEKTQYSEMEGGNRCIVKLCTAYHLFKDKVREELSRYGDSLIKEIENKFSHTLADDFRADIDEMMFVGEFGGGASTKKVMQKRKSPKAKRVASDALTKVKNTFKSMSKFF